MPTWDGETDDDFLTGTNWDGDTPPAPGDAVVVDGSAFLNQPRLLFGDSATVDTVSVSDGTFIIEGLLTATTGVTVSGGTFTIAGGAQVIGDVETLSNGTFELSGVLYGDLFSNGGTTEIEATGALSGSIFITAGDVIVQPSGYDLNIYDLTVDGGRLDIEGSIMVAYSLSGSGTLGVIDLEAAGYTAELRFGSDGTDTTYEGTIETEVDTGIVKQGAGATTLSGTISGDGTVTVEAGTLILSGLNSYTGTTTVSGGTLEVTGGVAIANTGVVHLGNGATFKISEDAEFVGSLECEDSDPATNTSVVQNDVGLGILGSADTTFAGNIAGGGQTQNSGGGTLTLTGVNTTTGNLHVDGTDSEITLTGIGSVASLAVAATAGGLITTDGGAFADTAADLQANGGTITMTGSEEAGSILVALTGVINIDGDDTALTLNGTSGYDNEINGIIAGTGTLDITGGATTVLATGDVQTDLSLGDSATLTNEGWLSDISTSGTFTNTGDIHGDTTVTGGTTDLDAGSDLSDTRLLTVTGGTVNINTAETIGALAVDGGTVNVSAQLNVGALSGTAGSVVLGDGIGIVVGSAGTSSTFAGSLSGDGFLQKVGSGTLTVTGMNSYAGDTLIKEGTLHLAGWQGIANTGAVVVSNGATLKISNNWETIGSLESEDTDPETCTAAVQMETYGRLTIAGAADTTFAGDIGGSGPLEVTGGGALTLSGTNTISGNLLADETGTEIKLTGIGSVASDLIRATNGALISTDGGAFANAGARLLADHATINLSGSEEVGGLDTYGGTINLNGSDTVLTLKGSGDDSANHGTIAGSGTLNLTGETVYNTGDVQTDITVSADGSMINSGTIANIMTSATFTNTGEVTGNITVTGGTADIDTGSDLAGTTTVNVSGGSLNFNVAQTIGTLDADGGTVNINAWLYAGTLSGEAGSIVLNADVGLVAGAESASSTFGGVLSGDGYFQKVGTGTLTLTGTNTVGGGTTISRGTLALTGSGSLSGPFATIDPAGTLSTDGGAFATNFSIRNDGTFSLTDGGDESIANISSGDGAIILSSGSVLTLNSGTSAIGGIVSGAGGLTISGTSNTTLSAASTYTGATIVSAGALAITGAGSIASASVNITGGTLTTDSDALSASATVGVSGDGTFISSGTDSFAAISQSGGTIGGSGVLTLSGAFNQSAGITAGSVDINSAGFAQSNGATLAAGTSVTSSSAQTLKGGTIAGSLDGAGAITASDGTTTLTGTITNAMSFTISSVIVNATGAGSIDTSGNLVAINGGLLNNDGDAIADNDRVSISDGILNLTGDDTIASLEGKGSVTLAGNALTMAEQTGALGAMIVSGGDGADAMTFTLAASLTNFTLAKMTFTDWTATEDTVTVTGNALANRITGGAAAETLDGGRGKDTMKGGGGKDTFLFHAGDGKDTITDFDFKGKDADIIDIEAITAITSFKDLLRNHVEDAGSNLVITLGGGHSIKLLGVQEKHLDADLFAI